MITSLADLLLWNNNQFTNDDLALLSIWCSKQKTNDPELQEAFSSIKKGVDTLLVRQTLIAEKAENYKIQPWDIKQFENLEEIADIRLEEL
jgi:hypothetical protein